VAFTPGSASLTAYKLTGAGVEWGKSVKDALHNPAGYSPSHSVRVPLLLSDRFLGSYLVPTGGIEWNYNFMGSRWSANLSYEVALSQPKEFYHPLHRTAHFLKFANSEQNETLDGTDREDLYA